MAGPSPHDKASWHENTQRCRDGPSRAGAAVSMEPGGALRARLHVVHLVKDDPGHLAQHLRPPAHVIAMRLSRQPAKRRRHQESCHETPRDLPVAGAHACTCGAHVVRMRCSLVNIIKQSARCCIPKLPPSVRQPAHACMVGVWVSCPSKLGYDFQTPCNASCSHLCGTAARPGPPRRCSMHQEERGPSLQPHLVHTKEVPDQAGPPVQHGAQNLGRHDDAARVGVDAHIPGHKADVRELLGQLPEFLVAQRLNGHTCTAWRRPSDYMDSCVLGTSWDVTGCMYRHLDRQAMHSLVMQHGRHTPPRPLRKSLDCSAPA